STIRSAVDFCSPLRQHPFPCKFFLWRNGRRRTLPPLRDHAGKHNRTKRQKNSFRCPLVPSGPPSTLCPSAKSTPASSTSLASASSSKPSSSSAPSDSCSQTSWAPSGR
ncbi:unnamed protein product, partial [Cyprideis torosa]